MGRSCRVCGRERSNESFGGKGRRSVVCKKCRSKGKSYVDRVFVDQEISGFLEQSNISKKNIARLKVLLKSENSDLAEKAALVLEVARVKPGKKRRFKTLKKSHPELFLRLAKAHLLSYPEPQYHNLYEDDDVSVILDSCNHCETYDCLNCPAVGSVSDNTASTSMEAEFVKLEALWLDEKIF